MSNSDVLWVVDNVGILQFYVRVFVVKRYRVGNMEGVYIYGEKRLVLVPDRQHPGDAKYSAFCDFNHGNEETADCRIVPEASKQDCAYVRISLEHEDKYHTRHWRTDHHHHDDHGVDHRGETVEHHYDIEGHDHPEHIDRQHHRIDHADDDDDDDHH